MKRFLVIIAATIASLADCASVPPQDGWRAVLGLQAPFDGTVSVSTRPDARNPSIVLDASPFVGHWIRLVADVEDSGALGLALSSVAGPNQEARVPLTLCDHETGPAHCWSTRYVRQGTSVINLVVFPEKRQGMASTVHLETYDGPLVAGDGDGTYAARIAAMIATLKENYYRSREVDWSVVEARIAPLSTAPPGVDPLPVAFITIRDVLPGREHTGVYPTVRFGTAAAANPHYPTCQDLGDNVRLFELPGTLELASQQTDIYIDRAHACLLGAPSARWIVDLRDNWGGSSWVMLAALAPLLSSGPQMANVNAAGRVMPVELADDGIVIAGATVLPHALLAVTGRSTAPAAVWISSRCASACEAVAIALSDRPGTRLVGLPTAGLTTGNEFIDVGRDLTGFYTAGWMAHADGRRVDGSVVPQITYEGDDPGQLKHWLLRR